MVIITPFLKITKKKLLKLIKELLKYNLTRIYFITVTPLRFSAHAAEFEPTTAGRSLPYDVV